LTSHTHALDRKRNKVCCVSRRASSSTSILRELMGAPRTHGELLKLDFEVAQSSVTKHMVYHFDWPAGALSGSPLQQVPLLDHIAAVGEAHLRGILDAYAAYYNVWRTHRSLREDAPFSRRVQRAGSMYSHAVLGGLHHHYVRI